MAYFLNRLTEELYLYILREHGISRVLFASDLPWLDQTEAVKTFNTWSLTDEERGLVYGVNAARLTADFKKRLKPKMDFQNL